MRIFSASMVFVVAGLPLSGAAVAQVLYDNGPLATLPTGTCIPAGETSSQLQTVGGVVNGVYGVGHMLTGSANQRIADDFTVTSASGWTILSADFFDYQTNAPTNISPISAVNLRIWSGQPGTANAAVVWGDATTNRMTVTDFIDMYRIAPACDLKRGLFRSTATIGVTLPPGTYWLDWQVQGSTNYSGPWSPLVTIAGQLSKPGSNSIQSLNAGDTWDLVIDDGPAPGGNTPVAQDLPFVLNGIVACYANCDLSTAPPLLNANDFQCFLNKYAAGDSGANCDQSTAPPVLNANDFQCFLNAFAIGCT